MRIFVANAMRVSRRLPVPNMTSTSTSSRTRRASPRGTRLALCLAFVIALAAAQPAEAFKWKWWKWNAIASHGHHGGHHGGSPKGDSVKHSGGHMKSSSWSGDDSECDDCGTWWRAKQWQQDSWWGKHSRRQDRDGWKPGTGLRAAKCMLHQCGWELKKCRFDMTCRESMQCAIGCGMGGDAASRACAFQCALDNRNDVTESLFTCVLDKGCMPEM